MEKVLYIFEGKLWYEEVLSEHDISSPIENPIIAYRTSANHIVAKKVTLTKDKILSQFKQVQTERISGEHGRIGEE